MSNTLDTHARYRVTSRYIEVDGRAALPVATELHFSRVPRRHWDERLRTLRAGGATEVSTYIFWNHHEEVRGSRSFDGGLDLRAFVQAAEHAGLGVILRVGPWSHGEARYGGFPDWVQHSGAELRTDDPRYLELVEEWFEALAEHLGDCLRPDGPVISIQIENELTNRPEHILTLKRILRETGFSAPFWTSSAWGSTKLPGAEVMPLFGGYADGFWLPFDAAWDTSFRSHFFFGEHWDDAAIGADVREQQGTASENVSGQLPDGFPIVTCELGSGMVGSYHRRPNPAALDVAAISSNALGSGSAWQGYYMFAGGSNPPGTYGLQESHATDYPSDLPRFDYDFHAPIGASGRLSEAYGCLRVEHAFLAAFGERLANMPASFPEVLPSSQSDNQSFRWSLRSDGGSGFVFIGWHQPHEPLADYSDAQFEVALADEVVTFPRSPITIPSGTVTRWPVNLTVGDLRLAWATATPLTILDGPLPTLVLMADPGVAVDWHLGPGLTSDTGPTTPTVDSYALNEIEGEGGVGRILVLASNLRGRVWVINGRAGAELLLSDDPLWLDADGTLRTRSSEPRVQRFVPALGEFVDVDFGAQPKPADVQVGVRMLAAHSAAHHEYGSREGRASGPHDSDVLGLGAAWSLQLEGLEGRAGSINELRVDWAGDVAQLWVDGRPVADRFWDGSPWFIDLDSLGCDESSKLVLRALPIRRDAQIYLPADARRRVDSTDLLLELDRVAVVSTVVWREQ